MTGSADMTAQDDIARGLGYLLRQFGGKAKKAPEAVKPQRIKVTLSVRRDFQGLPFRFHYECSGISPLDAEVQARQAAKKAGYVVWCTVDVVAGNTAQQLDDWWANQ